MTLKRQTESILCNKRIEAEEALQELLADRLDGIVSCAPQVSISGGRPSAVIEVFLDAGDDRPHGVVETEIESLLDGAMPITFEFFRGR